MNKRLQMLEQLAASDSADAFTLYGLAMEYRREGRSADGLSAFERLRDQFPNYLPTYLMAAQLLCELDQPKSASVWLKEGIALAQSAGDSKTLGELEELLATLDQ